MLDEALNTYRPQAWDVAYGSSGTAGAIGDILAVLGGPPGLITRSGLDWLREQLLRARTVDKVRLEGLKEDRRPVIGGGLSVLRAVFDLLDIREMQVAQGALRQGVLYDLLDRELHADDLRSSTVLGLMERFRVDVRHAERVARTAALLHQQACPGVAEQSHRELVWAARLHEIGCIVSHGDHHHHGAYLLDHTDAAGFSVSELRHLGRLVQGHRGKVRKLEADIDDPRLAHQLACLRMAVALCHARRDPDLEGVALVRDGHRFVASARPGWAAAYPQSAHLLREEGTAWQRTAWEFVAELT